MPRLTVNIRDDLGQTTSASADLTLSQSVRRWSDPWPELGGRVPDATTDVTIPTGVTIALDNLSCQVRRLTVAPGATLTKLTGVSAALAHSGNLIVQGLLEIVEPNRDVTCQITGLVASEDQYVGTTDPTNHLPVDSDIGLWVSQGRVHIEGADIQPWAMLDAFVAVNTSVIRVASGTVPHGWRVGDTLAICPTMLPGVDFRGVLDGEFVEAFDTVTITSLAPGQIRVTPSLRYAHAAGALVLNVTRNITVGGRPGLRTHVHHHNHTPTIHVWRNVAIWYVGPRTGGREVLGRWGLHFHMNDDNNVGTLVEGCVVAFAGSHAFVPHMSNGITFRSCITYETDLDAYWYDNEQAPGAPRIPGPNQTVYDTCIAARVHSHSSADEASGFFLGLGAGNQCINCYAIGCDFAGFKWPEGNSAVWRFTGCTALNCLNGIRVWQNDALLHVVEQFRIERCASGINHGAYLNDYLYQDGTCVNCRVPLEIHAQTPQENPPFQNRLIFRRLTLASIAEACVVSRDHVLEGWLDVTLEDLTCSGFSRAAIWCAEENPSGSPGHYVVRRLTTGGNRYWLDSTIPLGTTIRDEDLGLVIRRGDQLGTFRPEWNARVSPLE